MTTPEDVARTLAQHLQFPKKPSGAKPISDEARRIASALHAMARSIAAMSLERRADVERACEAMGVTIPVVRR